MSSECDEKGAPVITAFQAVVREVVGGDLPVRNANFGGTWEGSSADARFVVSSDGENRLFPCVCAARVEQLAATHPDDLTDEEQAELAGYVEACPECSAMLAEYRELGSILAHPPLRGGESANGQELELPPRILQLFRGQDI